jgi:hypothetical protein
MPLDLHGRIFRQTQGKRDRVMLVLVRALRPGLRAVGATHHGYRKDIEQSDQGLIVLIRASKTDRDAVGEFCSVVLFSLALDIHAGCVLLS